MEKSKKDLILKCFVMFFSPIVICLILCLLKGTFLTKFFVPSSAKNDCLFYYKTIEGILKFGMPQGYFGYNESRALIGSLPSWSPFIYVPWLIWGLIFGWNYTTAIFSNIVIFSFSLLAFTLLARPAWRNILLFVATAILFPSLPYYSMNLLPEILIASLLVVYYGAAFRFGIEDDEKKKRLCIFLMLILVFCLTVVRPYMITLIGLPAYWTVRNKMNKKMYVAVTGTGIFSVVIYFLSMHFFTSEYFQPLFDTELIQKVISFRLTEAMGELASIFSDFFQELVEILLWTVKSGLTSGSHYIVLLMAVIALTVICIDRGNKDRLQKELNISFIAVSVLLFVAILVLYHSAFEGGRHLFSFAVLGCLLCSFNRWSKIQLASELFIGIILFFLVTYGAFSPTDISVPVHNESTEDALAYWEEVFSEVTDDDSNETGYDNTIDFVYADIVENERVMTNFSELYAVPKGMGISCCTYDYIIDNSSKLKSRYVASANGGIIDYWAADSGLYEIGRTDNIVIYSRY